MVHFGHDVNPRRAPSDALDAPAGMAEPLADTVAFLVLTVQG